jgi:hypothetical protein
MYQSIATIDSPEFINLQPLEINPLMSSCEIKVLYLGENRNHSYITKEVATEMAKTLRGAPIVGYYKDQKQDFADHGEKIIFDDEGMKFECATKPYGFVAPDAKVWFQKFEDKDEFGNIETREYLMTTGYLWTSQYEECKSVIDNGKHQSMELDEETLDGHWSTNNKTGMDFFIINDAIFSKLCILGDDVEPCFEGARITAPEVSTSFTKIDDNFKKTLYSMMQDLKFALEGGQKMTINEAETTVIEEEQSTETVEETAEEVVADETSEEEMSTEKDNEEQSVAAEIDNPTEDLSSQENFAKADDEEKKEESDKEESKDSAEDSEDKKSDSEEEKEENSEEDEEDKKKKDYSLLETELEQAKVAYADLEEKYQALVAFKEQVDNEKKDALIGSFYMLSDEDKKDVIENKSKYSLDEIEAKLSVICVRKKVNFDLEDASKKDDVEENVMTYTVNDNENSTPAWIAALKNTRDSRK